MATEVETTEKQEAPARQGPGMMVWALVAVVAIGGGFAVPFLVPTGDSTNAGEPPKPVPGLVAHIPDEVAFLPFGEITVNLDDGRLSRYLRLSFSLQVEKSDELAVAKLIEEKKAILQNWLLSHLSDKSMDEIRGAAGQNRLRREIQDQFNTTLFPDGYDRVYDVLFEEFNVQ